jgi:hypothetical protein
MKKSIIAAGAASVALAAMPIVGVFATDHINGSPIVDTLQVNLSEVCTLSRGTTTASDPAHPTGTTASWTTGTVAATDGEPVIDNEDPENPVEVAGKRAIAGVEVPVGASRDTATADVYAGNFFNNFAQSSFKVACNNAQGGYKVTVTPSAFTPTTGTASAWAYAAGGADYTSAQIEDASASAWTLDSDATSKSLASGIVWSKAASSSDKLNEDSFTITYKVKVATAQEQNTYTADAVYTLADIN